MDRRKIWLKRLPAIIGGILTLLIAVGVYRLQGMFEKPLQAKKQIQQITVIQPPPPPPPPPEQKPPEPEPEPEKVPEPEPEEEPKPEPDEAEQPPGEELGVDAEGGAGSDGFGLVGKKGGRGLLGGSGGSAILWYGGQVKRRLEGEMQSLLAGTPAGKTAYSVLLNVWIGADGRVSRAELDSGSGKPEVDQSIRSALPKLRFALSKAPPENMPQPLKIKVTSRI
ncbi:energy transducer TonB family protein [Methylomicrobium sp. RS1]|jgi:protein TonB|uniref:energy transducer TonB family protein n=1 Tax=Candidatus Methylomicrobium oryzae TaxID=2802053 RepID=UPI001924500F|nr:energy transducer TonB [Methylomicrobium sp. RS1]MBL1265983.1 energy transducer TonB [Methylomicrobium sp. RS1]